MIDRFIIFISILESLHVAVLVIGLLASGAIERLPSLTSRAVSILSVSSLMKAIKWMFHDESEVDECNLISEGRGYERREKCASSAEHPLASLVMVVQLARGTETCQKNDSKGAVDFLRCVVVVLALRDVTIV